MNFLNRFKVSFLLCISLYLVSCDKKEITPELSVGSSEAVFTSESGIREVSVVSNVTWNIDVSSDWITATTSANSGAGKITITVAPNVAATQRVGIIAVFGGNISKLITVRQLGKVVADSIAPDQTGMRSISSLELAKEMKIGWNAGNSLDAIGGETAWGNPKLTRRLVDSIKAAGFNAVRLPVAWSRFSNASSFTIDTAWMARVEEVVNYVLENDMYAIINIHWDGGWMQPTYAKQQSLNNRLSIMWRQIAIRFRDYEDHLLFAGTNEVMVDGDYSTPTQEYYTVQNSFNQTFVSAVRSTGGRNAYRHLVVQGFNTNIDHTISFFEMPDDLVQDRLMVEVHYYDPYNFTLNESISVTQWGKNATDPSKTETWADESYADGQFQKMKTKFIDNGYPVILGEYGAIARLNLGSDAANAEYAKYRRYYMEYITQSAASRGLIPFYWDNGFTGDKGMGIFDRNTGAVVYPEIVEAIVGE